MMLKMADLGLARALTPDGKTILEVVEPVMNILPDLERMVGLQRLQVGKNNCGMFFWLCVIVF